MNLDEIIQESDYLSLPEIFYNKERISPLKKAFSLHVNRELMDELQLSDISDEDILSLLNGKSEKIKNSTFAMCYAGHQFGHFVPRLGDGRAINLGSYNNYQFQLKGAGVTLYSRSGDGRAVLRSSIREYIMAEAMHHLGVPTSRSLAIIGSDEDVARERWEKGSIVLRLAPSWVRFGTFEYFYHSNQHAELEKLADYVIHQSYVHLKDKEDAYFLMVEEIVENTAKMIASWQAVGFNHGVMNTDNMSIASITIDYGPFALLDEFKQDNICNHTDAEGRYSFSNQPYVAKWNIQRLMVAISPLINYERMHALLEKYDVIYAKEYLRLMRKKLGLHVEDSEDKILISELLGILHNARVDYHSFFRALCLYKDKTTLHKLCIDTNALDVWLEKYYARLEKEHSSYEEISRYMFKNNPKYVMKNHQLQEAIDLAVEGDYSRVDILMKLAQSPYDEHEEYEHLSQITPKKLSNLKLSCSS